MDLATREYLINKISCGFSKIPISNITFYLKPLSRELRYTSHEIYHNTLKECEEAGLYNEVSLLEFMLEENLWSESQEKETKTLEQDIENMKVGLIDAIFQSGLRNSIKLNIKTAKRRHEELIGLRNSYMHLSCSGVANMAKMKFSVAMGLRKKNGRPVYKSEKSFWNSNDNMLDKIINKVVEGYLSEEEYRELARTEPWRSLYNIADKEKGVFGVPSLDLTDEQRRLLAWSSLYNSVYEHPECPSDTVIEDDDAFDGWLILQSRKRRDEREGNEANKLLSNDKIRNSQEIYIRAESEEDAAKINRLNDPIAQAIKNVRMKKLYSSGGIVQELDMPDRKMEIKMEFNKRSAVRG